MRTCTGCKQEKSETDFSKNLHSKRCKACLASYARAWNAQHRDYLNAKRRLPEERAKASVASAACKRKRIYGLTTEAFEAMLIAQGRSCAICKDELRPWKLRHGTRGNRADSPNVDHCHDSNKVRGILCTRCNRGLGLFRDSASRLRAAADYLDRHKE